MLIACLLPYNCHIFLYQVGCGYPKLIKNNTTDGMDVVAANFIMRVIMVLLYALLIMDVD
jgi:hypothetical protein